MFSTHYSVFNEYHKEYFTQLPLNILILKFQPYDRDEKDVVYIIKIIDKYNAKCNNSDTTWRFNLSQSVFDMNIKSL